MEEAIKLMQSFIQPLIKIFTAECQVEPSDETCVRSGHVSELWELELSLKTCTGLRVHATVPECSS